MNNCNIIRLLNENGIAVEYGQIPDLWHIAQYVIEKGEKKGNSALVNQGKDIISVWHMAHDLKACAEEQGQARIIVVTKAERPNHWREQDGHPVTEWQAECSADDTRLGYLDWCDARREMAGADGVIPDPNDLHAVVNYDEEPEPDETMRLLRIAFAQATALSDNENIYDDNRGDSVPVEYVRKHLNGVAS